MELRLLGVCESSIVSIFGVLHLCTYDSCHFLIEWTLSTLMEKKYTSGTVVCSIHCIASNAGCILINTGFILYYTELLSTQVFRFQNQSIKEWLYILVTSCISLIWSVMIYYIENRPSYLLQDSLSPISLPSFFLPLSSSLSLSFPFPFPFPRGQQILKADLDALLASGMNSASEVILTGCSGEWIH